MRIGNDGIGPTLLDAVAENHADLLVMGAWGHSRFNEWVLGGATRYVLQHARLPVLMAH
ncbi:MAG TPA: universal stress protein [Dyella sp.]|uniref:universal stress protein n=1 Tax=Dyella sp. TaxID=1869338 RepID=UPI002F92DB2F